MTIRNWSMPEPKRSNLKALLTGQNADTPFPPAISEPGKGGKFDAAGSLLKFPGNTFICHIDRQSAFFEALCTMQDRLKAMPYADHFSFLPKASFHMTVFCGVSGDPLGQDGWTDALPIGSDLPTVTNSFISALKREKGEAGFSVKATGLVLPATIEMAGSNEIEEKKLRATRALLERVTGIKRGDIESYGFHVSMAYPVRWLSPDQADDVIKEAEAQFEDLLANFGPIALDPVEFCLFETMHRYDTIGVLDETGYRETSADAERYEQSEAS
ncbi:hypothetical protein SAMN04515647_1895 [Cohaesibacter sp. ES.047]|uniref:DUF1868 domain-containing protein n=1 Tax=Cohaesibacter sp. ES.047 TaxID=1798205 RepID=UPI000BB9AFB0|nr:DUF1868 domain-containing protein [Cohaesibacter sp. ES.047]SNY91667.1 hypothetical protein SAMN04515647_1895 [Cohaesibacter sp. ES.047]